MGHTKGQWETNEGYPDMVMVHPEKDGDCIFIAEASERKTKEEQYANARLIAASPLLLEACKKIKSFYFDRLATNDLEMLRDAIAKAEGG